MLAEQQAWNARDLPCTATHFIAHAIDDSIRKFLPRSIQLQRVILTGGGVKNGFLWRLLSERLAPLPLERSDGHGMAAEAKQRSGRCRFGIVDARWHGGERPRRDPARRRLLGRITPGSPSQLVPLRPLDGIGAGSAG